MQVVATAVVVGGGAMVLGLDWKAATAIGLIAAMSSTAIALSSLAERGMLKTEGGQAGFSILLFQDIAVIPILAVFPLLATAAPATTGPGSGRPAWLSAAMLLGAVGAVVLSGRLVIRPLFRFLASVRLRESFTAAALLIVVGIALLMQTVGLSPALGTFLAGVVLADSEYRHELESDVEPFKGLLLGLFFISVGAQLEFGLIAEAPLEIAGIVFGVMVAKLAILRVLGAVFGLDRSARWMLAFSLPQIGEFAFVLLSFAVQQQILATGPADLLVVAVAISMVLTPLLFIALERWVLSAVAERGAERAQDTIVHADTPVIIAGYGRYGQIIGRVLMANRIPVTILDLDPQMVDVIARLGIKVYYGDASRLDLLTAAGCERAKLFVLAVDNRDEATRIAEQVHKHFPNLTILARCADRIHYYELRSLGITHIYRETFGSAYETAIEALSVLGYRRYTAHRIGRRWREHDERELEELATLRFSTTDEAYWARVRGGLAEAERLMREEDQVVYEERDSAWDNESLRADPHPEAASSRES
jgi:Kef-type K+ transport system membrane component KefB/voltage-gated potassium channel Kch